MTRCVAQTVDDAAFPFVRNEHVGISGDAVLEACAAAEKTVRRIEFFIAYEFRSRMLAALMGSMFDAAFRKFASAFETRADEVFRPV